MKEIEQNEEGNVFAVPYFNNGVFKVRVFEIPEFETMDIKTQIKRSPEEIAKRELNINEALGLDDHTMPIDNFPDPFINCCFIDGKEHKDGTPVKYIFVNLFYSKDQHHHHFLFDYETMTIIEDSHEIVAMNCNKKNFPQKAFYNQDNNEVYTFYRQGQSFRIPIKCIDDDQNGDKETYYE